jgi:hypothetical protein
MCHKNWMQWDMNIQTISTYLKEENCYRTAFGPMYILKGDDNKLLIHTRCDQKIPRQIFLLGCGYTSGHTRPKCKPTVLSTSLETSETCCFSQEATETGGGGLGPTSRQCTSTHSTFHPGIFGKSWHSCRSATLTWLRVTFGCSAS